jgi:hypothetical protein
MPLTTVNPALLDTQAQYTGFKNRIINGDMRIDQRNAGASVSNSAGVNTYFIDRWTMFGAAASRMTGQRSTTAPVGFTNSALITSSAATTPGAGDAYGVRQYIEGLNMADFGWGTANAQTVTISFPVRASIPGTYSFALFNSDNTRSHVATYTINSANAWEQKSITIAGDTTGTWLTTNGIGTSCWWDLGSGSNFNATAGAWNSSLLVRTSGSANWIGTNGATFYITGVQLEKGSTATSFDYRPYGTELALCQRYFETNYDTGTAPGNGVTNLDGYKSGVRTAGELYGLHQIKFQVTKRGQPTITYYQPAQTATSGQWGYYDASVWVASTNTRTDNVGFTSFGVVMASNTLTGQNAYLVQGGWAASSEL